MILWGFGCFFTVDGFILTCSVYYTIVNATESLGVKMFINTNVFVIILL